MKRAFFCILFCIPFLANAQETSVKDGVPFYEKIISVEGASADNIFSRAKAAIAILFKDSKAVLRMDDKAEGRIIGKGNYQFSYGSYWENGVEKLNPSFTIDIQTKDSKCRIQLYDFSFEKYNRDGFLSETSSWKNTDLDFYRQKAAKNKKWAIEALQKFNDENLLLIKAFELEIQKSESDF